jgi:glucokinase
MASSESIWLVGDIGATNARFGLASPDGAILHSSSFANTDLDTIGKAISVYLAQTRSLATPRTGCLAIAAPVQGDEVRMTNRLWSFSIDALRDELGFERLEIINDFTAVALALPHLRANDRLTVGAGLPVSDRPLAVLGPGSGLGTSGLIPTGLGWQPLTSEGGHMTMGPVTERESAVLQNMRRQFDHISAERCLSGPGLVNLYNALAMIDGEGAVSYTAAQITDPATAVHDSLCLEATAMFCEMLGTVASNLALVLGAQGGVYIAGGIVPRLGARFAESGFRSRFETKGRFSDYLAAIPTYVVTHPLPAFLGCAAALAYKAADIRSTLTPLVSVTPPTLGEPISC